MKNILDKELFGMDKLKEQILLYSDNHTGINTFSTKQTTFLKENKLFLTTPFFL